MNEDEKKLIYKLSNSCKFKIRVQYGKCTTRVPVDQAPAGPALDAAVAVAAGYIQVPFASGKKIPPELEDVPITEKRYVYVLVWNDGSEFQRGVWRRRHGGGDFFLWQPSTDIRDTWELWQDAKENCWADFIDELEWRADDSSVFSVLRYVAPLAITRAYLKANGVEWVEVPD